MMQVNCWKYQSAQTTEMMRFLCALSIMYEQGEHTDT